jgi:hypothetical protein
MADHAEHLVGAVQRVDGVVLDYSVDSLGLADEVLGRFHDAGDDPDQMAETLFQVGSYIGEVIVRNANGEWTLLEADHPLGNHWPMVVLPSAKIVNPIGTAFKRVRNGSADAIPYFYDAPVAD